MTYRKFNHRLFVSQERQRAALKQTRLWTNSNGCPYGMTMIMISIPVDSDPPELPAAFQKNVRPGYYCAYVTIEETHTLIEEVSQILNLGKEVKNNVRNPKH